MPESRLFAALAAVAASAFSVAAVDAAVILAEPKLLSGWQAPSASAGVVLTQPSSNPAVISDTGRGAGVYGLSGPGVTFANDLALYIGAGPGPGNAQLIARDADPAPGLPAGVTYSNFQNVALNGDNLVRFNADLAGSGVTLQSNYAAFGGTPGNIAPIVREGDPAPHLAAGVTIREFYGPEITAGGSTAYVAFVQGPGVTSGQNDTVLYAGPIGSASVIARAGDATQGLSGLTLRQLGVPKVHDSERLAVLTLLSGPGVTTSDDDALWIARPGVEPLTLARRAGTPAPGTPAGVTFSGFGQPLLGGAGGEVLAFQGVLSGPGVTFNNNTGFWTGPAAAPRKVIRLGDPAPGAASGVTFSDFGSGNLVAGPSNSGAMFFQATVIGPGISQGVNDRALWVGDGNTLTAIARLGDPVPGGSPGQNFTFFNDWVINANNQVAFVGSWGFGANQSAIFATNPQGQLVQVVRPGDTIDLGGGDLRTLSSFNFGETTVADRIYLNDNGTLVLKAFFTNGTSGVITIQVPEPGSALAGAVVCALAWMRRRR